MKHKEKVDYIYRHLLRYGNTVLNTNPRIYQKDVNALGIDYTFEKIANSHHVKRGRKSYHYILTKI